MVLGTDVIVAGMRSPQGASAALLRSARRGQVRLAASTLYARAADLGDIDGQVYLGLLYEEGRGVAQNYLRAAQLFEQAAQQGDSEAQVLLADLYFDGLGVKKNYAAAFQWYLRAAEAGYADGQFSTGIMYELGEGTAQSYSTAAHWYRQAAVQGHSLAQQALGSLDLEGLGVERNIVEAFAWLSLASQAGDTEATNQIAQLRKILTAEQIRAAEQRAVAYRTGQVPSVSPAPERSASSAVPRTSTVPVAVIASIQQSLTDLGYAPGPIDGQLGPRTTEAIKSFQEDFNIEPDGIASTTLAALLSAVLVEQNRAQPVTSQAREQPELVGNGTGFFVAPEGVLLTNYHVIEDCRHITAAVGGSRTDAKLLATDESNDLALLQIDAPSPAVAQFRRQGPQLGEDVFVAGFPLHGLLSSMNFTSGNVSATTGLGGDARLLQTTAPVQPGNSGGPMLDASGRVIGVVVVKLDAMAIARETGDIPQNINFAIKGAIARSFLSVHDINYAEGASNARLERTAVAQSARRFTTLVECWDTN